MQTNPERNGIEAVSYELWAMSLLVSASWSI